MRVPVEVPNDSRFVTDAAKGLAAAALTGAATTIPPDTKIANATASATFFMSNLTVLVPVKAFEGNRRLWC
jgi:hypothetical protein